MNSGNVFGLRTIAAFMVVLGVFGTSLTDLRYIELPFRILLISGGLLSFFKNKVGIVLLLVALALSIPDVEIGSFYWTPVRLFRLPIGGSLSSPSGNYRFGIDIVSIVLLRLISVAGIPFLNARKNTVD